MRVFMNCSGVLFPMKKMPVLYCERIPPCLLVKNHVETILSGIKSAVSGKIILKFTFERMTSVHSLLGFTPTLDR